MVLREQLEQAHACKEDAVMQMAAAHRAELTHLHETVRMLRDELEARHG